MFTFFLVIGMVQFTPPIHRTHAQISSKLSLSLKKAVMVVYSKIHHTLHHSTSKSSHDLFLEPTTVSDPPSQMSMTINGQLWALVSTVAETQRQFLWNFHWIQKWPGWLNFSAKAGGAGALEEFVGRGRGPLERQRWEGRLLCLGYYALLLRAQLRGFTAHLLLLPSVEIVTVHACANAFIAYGALHCSLWTCVGFDQRQNSAVSIDKMFLSIS